jgi:hypothetical protein
VRAREGRVRERRGDLGVPDVDIPQELLSAPPRDDVHLGPDYGTGMHLPGLDAALGDGAAPGPCGDVEDVEISEEDPLPMLTT